MAGRSRSPPAGLPPGTVTIHGNRIRRATVDEWNAVCNVVRARRMRQNPHTMRFTPIAVLWIHPAGLKASAVEGDSEMSTHARKSVA